MAVYDTTRKVSCDLYLSNCSCKIALKRVIEVRVVLPVLLRWTMSLIESPAESPPVPSESITTTLAEVDSSPVLSRCWMAVEEFVTKPPDAGEPFTLKMATRDSMWAYGWLCCERSRSKETYTILTALLHLKPSACYGPWVAAQYQGTGHIVKANFLNELLFLPGSAADRTDVDIALSDGVVEGACKRCANHPLARNTLRAHHIVVSWVCRTYIRWFTVSKKEQSEQPRIYPPCNSRFTPLQWNSWNT